MSVDNSELLMLLGGKKVKYTIGVQGKIGFGGGLYGGDPADLKAIGLSPMPNNDNPTNENYGSYVHTNGSVMLFIPAFCYRIGRASAPSYSRDGANALEIRDAGLGEGDGWILHRAFIDGDVKKSGFFIDKYLCSKDSTGDIAISVKNGSPIATSTMYNFSNSMPDCLGKSLDAITLSRARGEAYACVSAFQWSAIAMLSLAHGQATNSTKDCAWFDPEYRTNFPKGNNSRSLTDVDDSSVSFTKDSNNYGTTCLTGSASDLAKTTHTGQIWGITDINGNRFQPLLGLMQQDGFRVAKESVKMHDFTKDNCTKTSMFEERVIGCGTGVSKYFGQAKNQAFFTETSGSGRALCGVVPTAIGYSSSGTRLFGYDLGAYSNNISYPVFASGFYGGVADAGIWYRNGNDYLWSTNNYKASFRAAGYPP